MEDWIMKKSLFFAAALFALAACTREMDNDSPKADMSLVARTETPAESRTVVEGETHVYWEAGDQIAVFSGKKSGKFTTDLTATAATATFTGTLGTDAWTEGMDLWAVYPYSEEATFDGAAVTTTLPAEQVARPGSFGKDMNLAIAHSTTSTLQFYNVGGGIRFSLSQEGIRKVVLEGLDGELLAGKVKVGFQDGVPAVLDVIDGKTSITVTPAEEDSFQKDAWYYIVAVPGTLEKGFKLHFYKTNSLGSKAFEKTVTIKRSIYGTLTHADDGVEISPVIDMNIRFKDNMVKAIAVNCFDTDGDQELSYREAAVVRTFLVDEPGTRADNDKRNAFAGTAISAFDELVFFTGLSKIDDGAFAGCVKLESVTIPENVTAIGDNAFNGCTGLQAVTLMGETPPAIGTDAFADSGDCPITVPEDAVDQYVSSWSAYAQRIRTYTYPEPEAVDMGVSVKWASFNLGASKPEEYGEYFAWGETEPKTVFNPATYQWWDAENMTVSNYLYYPWDNRYDMQPEEDAARVKLGGDWRMPSMAELTELYDHCSVVLETIDGIGVYKLVSKVNGNCIYLPRAGYYEDAVLNDKVFADIWTASLYANGIYACSGFDYVASTDAVYMRSAPRYFGIPIRPVSGGPGIPVESITLDKNELTLYIDETVTLTATVSPENATIKDYTWTSNNDRIVTVSSTGEVVATGVGNTYIYVLTLDGRLYARCNVTVRQYDYSVAVPEMVALGLSVKWASFNLGATKPEEYGDYFAWGETQPYYTSLDPLQWKSGKDEGYYWPSYKWSMDTENTFTKYCSKAEYGYNGYTDDKVVLDARDDAAHLNLGGNWRMPTDAEWEELMNGCTSSWTTENGVNGYRFTSNVNGNSIFLPAAGFFQEIYLLSTDSFGLYWSSSLYDFYPDRAWCILFLSNNSQRSPNYFRNFGLTVRPVYDDSGESGTDSVIWENDGSRGEVNWNIDYRFGLEGTDPGNECIATFPGAVWNIIKNGTFQLLLEGTPDLQIRVTTGWWDPNWIEPDITVSDDRLTDNGDGTYTLTICFGNSPFVDYLDERHLLFTGSGYTPLKLSTKVGGPVQIWENDGMHGAVSWTGDYRFAREGLDYDGGALATFSKDIWDVIKNGTFYLDLEGTDPYIRVTTGWWDVQWTGQDIGPGDKHLTDNNDGTWTLKIDFGEDPIVDFLDEHNLLFTGARYTPLRLYFIP